MALDNRFQRLRIKNHCVTHTIYTKKYIICKQQFYMEKLNIFYCLFYPRVINVITTVYIRRLPSADSCHKILQRNKRTTIGDSSSRFTAMTSNFPTLLSTKQMAISPNLQTSHLFTGCIKRITVIIMCYDASS